MVRRVEAGPRLRGAPEAGGVVEASEGGAVGKGGARLFPPQRLCEGELLSGAAWEGGVVVGGEMGFEVVRFEARSSQGDSAESLRENSVCIF